MTVQELFERWASIELVQRKDVSKEIHRTFEKDVLPNLGKLHAEDITRSMVTSLLDRVVERGARIVARNMLGDLRQMYGFVITLGLVEHNPTYRIKEDDWGRKVERDRVLDAVEIKLLAQKIPEARLSPASIANLWIMLSTCCRIGEITQARWEHVDLKTTNGSSQEKSPKMENHIRSTYQPLPRSNSYS